MTEKRIQFSNIVKSQVPTYVANDFPLISEFLKQYYLSQEFKSAPIDLIQNIDQYIIACVRYKALRKWEIGLVIILSINDKSPPTTCLPHFKGQFILERLFQISDLVSITLPL